MCRSAPLAGVQPLLTSKRGGAGNGILEHRDDRAGGATAIPGRSADRAVTDVVWLGDFAGRTAGGRGRYLAGTGHAGRDGGLFCRLGMGVAELRQKISRAKKICRPSGLECGGILCWLTPVPPVDCGGLAAVARGRGDALRTSPGGRYILDAFDASGITDTSGGILSGGFAGHRDLGIAGGARLDYAAGHQPPGSDVSTRTGARGDAAVAADRHRAVFCLFVVGG